VCGECPPLICVQLRGLEAHVISQTGHEGKERLHGRFVLCHPPLGKAPPLFFCPAPAARGSRHKPCHPKRQRAPLWLPCLMLVASGRAASAFLFVQLRGLEAYVISQTGQEGKERLHVRFVLCHPPLGKAPPLFCVLLFL
jgi:hypothetical protein